MKSELLLRKKQFEWFFILEWFLILYKNGSLYGYKKQRSEEICKGKNFCEKTMSDFTGFLQIAKVVIANYLKVFKSPKLNTVNFTFFLCMAKMLETT